MNLTRISASPEVYPKLLEKCKEIGFTMPSDIYFGTLLKTLIQSKPASNILELGTGIGLSLAWMIEGLDEHSRLTTIDNDPSLIRIASQFFGSDYRVKLICADGSEWLKGYIGDQFDLIFADAWPGKYRDLDKTLEFVRKGGFYVVDDMNPQPNWPEGHEEKVEILTDYLEKRKDLSITKMDWSTGVILCVKK